jgi:hypothetical protein
MAADERDQQADALEKLAKGEAAEPDLPLSSGTVNLSNNLDLPPALLNHTQPAPDAKKPIARPPAPTPVSKRSFQPSTVPAPTLGASEKKTRAFAPVQPPTPRERPAAPPKRDSSQDHVNVVAPSTAEPGDLSSALAHVVEESDAMSAPAPEMSMLARSRKRPKARQKSFFATLGFRQTIIPILLVLGVSFPALAIGWLMLDRDSLLRSKGPALPITLACVGLVMLGLAIVNMLAVKHEIGQGG